LFFLVLTIAAFAGRGRAATPGFTLTASNPSVPGQGDGSTTIMVKSVGGFSGQVGIGCSGPDANLLTDLVLPVCPTAGPILSVPANGTVTGSIAFYPPWANPSAMNSHGKGNSAGKEPRGTGSSPLALCVLAGAGLVGLRLRKIKQAWLAVTLGVLCLGSLTAITGCIGQGGLAMTPGTYAYTITGNSQTASPATEGVIINVTVQCNSCP
jgi:hypothetical protein